MVWISVIMFAIGIYGWAFFASVNWKTLAAFPFYLFFLALITGVV